MPLPAALARFNRVVTNRVVRPLAAHLPYMAVVEHRGRRSGRVYRTPVNVFADGDRYRFALTYGPGVDWLRNVRAAGGCVVITRGRTVTLTAPRTGHDPGAAWAPPPVRWVLTTIGATDYLDCTAAP
ncbi:nitroreductase family deazaflavin-dependent oxidoreductase [Rhodococcus phenolicus]|uniref:nitroreductase family deazaflavin-dependent oxidoreductase n=1 Tax=Rhodococcus phenolicus TaxID=263849 RepID=UPI0008314377|nr:nitroreductase family deazaflavin-dependent oxidoreductase [Rhodococcus phenolicus]